ncbi:MFS transporter [Paenibacillus sp. CAA11]|uniref:MFS transporter n=1 Tax=Paenibacillus sp. CAA11 TaxID=1532905 RepID=UPI000D35E79C|nr:MFS transporter [Paenibacillus sp. CAA11]AWB44619.1 MFS transporter [Paenibacillus sp. CAA11]
MSLLARNRFAIPILMFNILLVFTGIGLVIPVMPTFMNELHLNGSFLGFMVAAFSLSQLLFSPLAGKLSDSIGRKKNIIAGIVLFALSEWLFGVASHPVLLFLARIVGGIGSALVMPSVMAYVADMTNNEERAKGMGLINAAITTGFVIGPGIGGYLAEYGIRVPFYTAGIAGAFAAIITLFVLPDSKPEQHAPEDSLAAANEKKPGIFNQLMLVYREPYFISLIIVLVASFGLANFETVFSLFMDHKFSYTPKDIAFIITFTSIAGAVVQLTAFGWLLNTFGEGKIIKLTLLTAAVFTLLVLFANSYWTVLAVTFVLFLSIDILRPAIGTYMSKLAGQQQGYIAGLNSSFTSMGNILGPLIAGVLFDINITFPYITASIVIFISFVLALKSMLGREELSKSRLK